MIKSMIMLVLKDNGVLKDLKDVKVLKLLLYYRYRVQLNTTELSTTQTMSHDKSCTGRQINNQATVALK